MKTTLSNRTGTFLSIGRGWSPMTLVLTVPFSALALLAAVGQVQPAQFCDDFEDGVVNSSLWVWGGNRAGYGGVGVGSWQWSHTEAGGSLQLRVWGPASGITYGGEAWVRSKSNFNDGLNHMINFTWGASVNASHVDAYAIEICNAEVDVGLAESSAWFAQDSPGNKNRNRSRVRCGGAGKRSVLSEK